MRFWKYLLCGLMVCLAPLQAASANHVPRVSLQAYLGSTNHSGPSAEAFDSVRGLVYQAFLGSGRVVVVRRDNLSVRSSWALPDWSTEGTLAIALSPAGDRIAVLHTTATSGYIAIYSDAGGIVASTSFVYDGSSLGFVMTPTTAFIARAGLPLLSFNGTLRELDTVPAAALASLTQVDGDLAYFAATSGGNVNLVLLTVATSSVRTTGFYGPVAASYVVRPSNAHLYIASCGGLAQVNIASGALVRSLGTDAIGCLTDVAVSPDDITAIVLPFTSSGETALTYVSIEAGMVGRRVGVPGGHGRLVGSWQNGSVYVTTSNYTTGQQSYTGVLDVASGTLRAIPYSVAFADATYGIAVGNATLQRYDPHNDTWLAGVYGGFVSKTIRTSDGTTFAQIGDAVARIRPGATSPDAFYAGGTDMVLDGATLYSHNGRTVFTSDINGDTSRVLAPLQFPRYRPGMAYDAATKKLILSWWYQPRNALAQAGITLVDTTNGAKQELLSQSAPSIAIAHDPVGHRVYAATGRFGSDGAPANTGELTVFTLGSGASTMLPVQQIALSSPQLGLAFDAARGLLAISDGANIAAINGTGRQIWTTAVNGRALDVRSASWILGGDNSLALIDPATGRIKASARVGYQLTDVGMVNDLVYGFDAVSGALISAQPAASGLVFQIEGTSLPSTSWETTSTSLVVGDQGGIVSVTSPHQGSGGRGTISTFYSRWQRADGPIISGAAQRSWTWGPRPWAVQVEAYAEGVGGYRLVEYRDKARMEVTRSDADTKAPGYVTNGLLVQEMLSGQIQTGDQRFEPAPCPNELARTGCANATAVAGDSVDNANAPTYADMQGFTAAAQQNVGQRTSAFLALDSGPTRSFIIGSRPELATDFTELVEYDTTTQHNIPRVFVNFMNQRGPVIENGKVVQGPVVDALFAFGRPVTEPYWTQARVGGELEDVLIQLFERRVLTYTPTNPAQYQVEMGNVGQHYYHWRYDETRW